MNTESATKVPPPYVAYATFKNLLGSLKEGVVPARIDKTLPFMMGQSGSNQSYLFSALRFFNLIDENKKPTPAFKPLVLGENDERKALWRRLFDVAYHPILDGLDLDTATVGMLHEKFQVQGLTGETVRKAHSFFGAAAEDAGISLTGPLKPKARGSGPRRAKKSKPARNGQDEGGVTASAVVAAKTVHELLLEKFPPYNPEWTPELQAKWFDGYEKLLKAAMPAS